jgi:hypothetical protein
MSVSSWQARRQRRRLQRGADRIESSLTGAVPAGTAASRPARDYGRTLRLALRLDPPLATPAFRPVPTRWPSGPAPPTSWPAWPPAMTATS